LPRRCSSVRRVIESFGFNRQMVGPVVSRRDREVKTLTTNQLRSWNRCHSTRVNLHWLRIRSICLGNECSISASHLCHAIPCHPHSLPICSCSIGYPSDITDWRRDESRLVREK
jgi:hypothetical protein